ncbi:AMP-binding protein [Streptacidiphilus melanogenes]|uniref:AMP-binding protein n=1 Tax=Streptacidiphilus melanogenes TaxID=411235 RepID=UPI0006950A34|nr:AMP-binding protein [Streptacidiphilus melanogenes]
MPVQKLRPPGRVPPAEHLARAVQQLVDPGSGSPDERVLVEWPRGGASGVALLELLPAELPFDTSGTTGPPTTWWRAGLQLVSEGQLLVETLGLSQVDAVVTYAPTRHLYGFLFGCVVPALLGVPVYHVDLGSPLPFVEGRRPLVATLPAAWWHLKRSGLALDRFDALTLVHSSAHLPPTADEVCAGLGRRARLYELHGSTETGLVATRVHGEGDVWHLAEDVRLAHTLPPDCEYRLEVRSPRLARRTGEPRPSRLLMDDLVLTGRQPRTFRLLGRHSRLVKVNGRRVDLGQVEALLLDAVPDAVLSCEAVRDPLRGEWHEVLVAGGSAELDAVAEACRRVLLPWQAPRGIRQVQHTHRTPKERTLLR